MTEERKPFGESPTFQPKVGLKKTNGPKSMFENKPKPPSPQEFQKQVQNIEDRQADYKQKAADLFIKFQKCIRDKTLITNRNILSQEAEKELLHDMVQLAIEINNDPNQQYDGMGSLTWITCLFKTCLEQRDKINELEYALSILQKRLESNALTDFIKKEIAKILTESSK